MSGCRARDASPGVARVIAVRMEQEAEGGGMEVKNEFWSRARMVIRRNRSTQDYIATLKTKVGAALADRRSQYGSASKEMSEGRKFCEVMHDQWTKYLHEEILLLKIERQNELFMQEQLQILPPRRRHASSGQIFSATPRAVHSDSSTAGTSTAEALRIRTTSSASKLDSQVLHLSRGVSEVSQRPLPVSDEPAFLDRLSDNFLKPVQLLSPASDMTTSKKSGAAGKKRIQKYLKGMSLSFAVLQHQMGPSSSGSPTTGSPVGDSTPLNEQKLEISPETRSVAVASLKYQAASKKRMKKPKFSESQASSPSNPSSSSNPSNSSNPSDPSNPSAPSPPSTPSPPSAPSTPSRTDCRMQDSAASNNSDGRTYTTDWATWTVNGSGVAPRVTLAAADVAATGGKKIKKAWEKMRKMVIKKHEDLQMENGNPLVQVAKSGELKKPDRGACWIALACSDTTDVMSRLHYAELVSQPCHLEREIVQDVHRTFQQHKMFQEEGGPGQTALFNVIKAYANLDNEVGYCQGMAALVAILLTHMKEEDAFVCMVFLMYHCGLRSLFISNMEQLQVRLFQLSQLIVDRMPKLHSHMESLNVKPVMYAAPWFLTLFATSLPQYLVDRVFDIVFAERTNAIVFKLALVLVQVCMRQLLQCTELEHFMHFLRHELGNELRSTSESDMEELIDKALRVGLPFENLLKLEAEYELLEEEAALAANEVAAAVAANKVAAGSWEPNRAALETRLKNALVAQQEAEQKVEALSQKLRILCQGGMGDAETGVSEQDIVKHMGLNAVGNNQTRQKLQAQHGTNSSNRNPNIRRNSQKIEKLDAKRGEDSRSAANASDLGSALHRAQPHPRVSAAAAASATAVGVALTIVDANNGNVALQGSRSVNGFARCNRDEYPVKNSLAGAGAAERRDNSNGIRSSNSHVGRGIGCVGSMNGVHSAKGAMDLQGARTATSASVPVDGTSLHRRIPPANAMVERMDIKDDNSTLRGNSSENDCVTGNRGDERTTANKSACTGMGEAWDGGVGGQQQGFTIRSKLNWKEAPTFFAKSVQWLRSERPAAQQALFDADQKVRMEQIQADIVENICLQDC